MHALNNIPIVLNVYLNLHARHERTFVCMLIIESQWKNVSTYCDALFTFPQAKSFNSVNANLSGIGTFKQTSSDVTVLFFI